VGDLEVRQAVQDGWMLVHPEVDPAAIQRFTAANVSPTDAAVIAFAQIRKATLLLADDAVVREVARREGLAVMGTVGILVRARLAGLVDRLQPLLDQLIAAGFYLEAGGDVYQVALERVAEL
jgi:uncharacterized protein